MGRPVIDRTGEKHNHLTIIKRSDRKCVNGSYYWWCQCDCGSPIKEIEYGNLRNGSTKSCGECKQYNTYDLTSCEYGIGYLSSGEKFYFDLSDYELISKYNWSKTGSGYLINTSEEKTILIHRLIMGATGKELVDHINHNTLDNRRSNLRKCNGSQNNINKNTAGYTIRKTSSGVKYEVSLKIKGKYTYVGRFDSVEEALQARKAAYDEDHKIFEYQGELNDAI